MFSLRKLFWLVFPTTMLLLGMVIILGARQYALSGKYTDIITENEKALFHFITIREDITEALITKDSQKLLNLIPDMEKLNATFSRMQETPYVPAELKLDLLNKIDLPGIVIQIRTLATEDGGGSLKQNIQQEMRNIGTYLVQYDRILATQTRSRIHNLQLIIIGSMGIILSILSFSLILLYRNSILPVLNITKQLQQESVSDTDLQPANNASLETLELVEAIHSQIRAKQTLNSIRDEEESAQYSILIDQINGSTNQLNGLINYAQLLADTDEHLYSAQQKKLLDKIIETSSEIERSWKQF
ncbi:hypothetical protein [Desulforhopalus sp. 52FAK]